MLLRLKYDVSVRNKNGITFAEIPIFKEKIKRDFIKTPDKDFLPISTPDIIFLDYRSLSSLSDLDLYRYIDDFYMDNAVGFDEFIFDLDNDKFAFMKF